MTRTSAWAELHTRSQAVKDAAVESSLDVWPLETIMEDIAVVLDEARLERAAPRG